MIINIGICMSFIIILFIISFVFFSKKKVLKIENIFFSKLIIITIIGLLIESIIYYLLIYITDINNSVYIYLVKMLYIYYVFWMFYFVLYGYVVFFKVKSICEKKYNRFKNVLSMTYLIFIILSIILPINIKITNTFMYPDGIGTIAQYFIVSYGMIIISISAFCNKKVLFNKQALPLIFCIVFGIVCSIIQFRYHEFLFIVPSHAIAIILMFFTIENPDLKIIEEYNKNKELVEDNFEDRTNTLFQISEEVRTPIIDIKILSEQILICNNKKDIKRYANSIKELSSDVSDLINNILNISSMDINSINRCDKKYKSNELFNQIILIIEEKKNEINFKYCIKNNIPKYLKGDSLRLKEVIISLLLYSLDKTKDLIDLDISAIIHYNICRLIIKTSNNGKIIPLEVINSILEEDEGSLNYIEEEYNILKDNKKIIEIMGGSFLIKSNNNINNFTIVIDQEIQYSDDELKLEEISRSLSNKKKVLLIDDNYKELKLYSKILEDNSIEVDSTMLGKDIYNNTINKYDLIFIDDEMKPNNAVELIKRINNDKIKIIIMLEKNKEIIKNHYLDNYCFADYLLKNNYREEFKRIINKYL